MEEEVTPMGYQNKDINNRDARMFDKGFRGGFIVASFLWLLALIIALIIS